MAVGAIFMARLRSDAKLSDLPVATFGQRGRPRECGKIRMSLMKRAIDRRDWQSILYVILDKMVAGCFKTFLTTSRDIGDPVRVVLLEHTKGNRAAEFNSHTTLSLKSILKMVSDRWATEKHFYDAKWIWGAGEQQI